MLMNFSSKRKPVHATPVFFPGRTGHRAARINDSIFVLGGTDKTGGFVNEVHRINCLNNKIDTLILQNTISIEGFSLFSFQETLFLWGGRRLQDHVNLLLQFDGTKFAPLKQHGIVPAPRAFHASATFGGKYLILFGGCNQFSFFNDWSLLNLKTLEWKTLTPSLNIKECLSCSMVWTNGRGILLTNEIFSPTSGSNIPNTFYEFYVKDFNKGTLKVLPLQLTFTNSIFQEYIFRHMTVSQHNSILIFGGYHLNDPTDLHSHSYILSFDPMKLEKSKIRYKQKSQFESIYHKNKLFIIGGILSSNQMESFVEIYENPADKHNYRRHVCQTCKLYFDQEWFKTSKEAFPYTRIKEEYDYNYHLKIDNRILAKFSTYITNEVYAISLIIDSLRKFTANQIQISFHKDKQNYSHMISEMVDETHYFLKVACDFGHFDTNLIVNELLMMKQRQCQNCSLSVPELQLGVLRLKIGSLRLGRSCLFCIKISKDQICIIYFSCNQLQCTNSNFYPFTNYHYYLNTKTKECSSRNNRHIILENLKRNHSTNYTQFEEIGNHSFSMLVFCGDEMQGQFVMLEHNQDVETGETCPVLLTKEQNRKAVSLIQFSFLPAPKSSNVFIQQSQVNFINIIDILKGDFSTKVLTRIDSFDQQLSSDIFQKIELFEYPSQYWFRRMLIYHSNRLIMHFQGKISVCGVIVLKPTVQLDLSGNHLANLDVEAKVRNIINDLKNLKRPAATF